MRRRAESRLEPLPRGFYERSAVAVAADCLGRWLVHESAEGTTVGRIVEAEAYEGPEDRAAHSFGGRRTARTEAMFGPPGHAYVFFLYGMHWNFNVVTGPVGSPCAVLLRAVEPVAGQALMARRRGREATDRELTNGPAKLCQAFGISREHYGQDLCEGPLRLATGSALPPERLATAPRVGVEYAGEWADRPWRFFDRESPQVSTARAPRTRRARGELQRPPGSRLR